MTARICLSFELTAKELNYMGSGFEGGETRTMSVRRESNIHYYNFLFLLALLNQFPYDKHYEYNTSE